MGKKLSCHLSVSDSKLSWLSSTLIFEHSKFHGMYNQTLPYLKRALQ